MLFFQIAGKNQIIGPGQIHQKIEMETQVTAGFNSFKIIKQAFGQRFEKIIRLEIRFVENDGDLLTWLCFET